MNGNTAEQINMVQPRPSHSKEIELARKEHADHARPGVNWVLVARQALRGRLVLVIGLGIVTAAISAAVTWTLVRPVFESQGLIRIANSLPTVMEENDLNRAMPAATFDTYMMAQKSMLSNHKLIEKAIDDPIWNSSAVKVPAMPFQYFAAHLRVDYKPRSEFIQVSVLDPDPVLAGNAVTSIINAYRDFYSTEEKRMDRQRSGILSDQQVEMQKRVGQVSAQVRTELEEFGGVKPDILCEAAATRVAKLSDSLAEIHSEIARLSGRPDATTRESRATASLALKLSPAEIAVTDPQMRRYLQVEADAEDELARLTLRVGPANPIYKTAVSEVELAKARAQRYADNYNQITSGAAASPGDPALSAPPGPRSLESLQAYQTSLDQMTKQATTVMTTLGEKRMDLEAKEQELSQLRQDLTRTENRILSLNTEAKLGSRLTVISSGEVPLSPEQDKRLQMAAAAGLGGSLLPAAVVVLMSLLRRRYRYASDVPLEVPVKVPLLGIVPEIKNESAGDARAVSARYGVHQIRLSLGAYGVKEGPSVYLITSSTAEEGRTSLAMSLGLSFTASHLRTLVIDASPSGTGTLTNGASASDYEGLAESIKLNSLGKRVRKTDAGVYLLTSGRHPGSDSGALSSRGVQAVLREARDYFDVVLIDSGPILGSLEASVIAPEVDGVIFVISRGQERDLAEMAMQRLRILGAKVIGYVFNRASSEDLVGTPYQMPEPGSQSNLQDRGKLPRFAGFGLLVRAVAQKIPVTVPSALTPAAAS